MKWFTISVTLFLVLLGGSLGGGASSRPVLSFVKAGEYLRYRAKVGEVKGGTTFLMIKRVRGRGGQKKITAVIKARTNTFFDKIHRVNNRFESLFDLTKRGSYRYRMDVDQAGTLQLRKIHFQERARSLRLILYTKNKKKPDQKKPPKGWTRKYRTPKGTRDLVSAIYFARSLPYHSKKTFKMHVFVASKLWRLTGKVLRKERIYSIFGSQQAYVVRAGATCLNHAGPRRYFQAWISADSRRIPLKIQGYVPYLGNASAILIGYRANYNSRYLDGTRSRRLRRFLGRF